MTQSERLVVFITAGSAEEADRLAEALVQERLAACVNIVPGLTSVYRWEGALQRDQEWLLIAKTRRERFAALVERVQTLHSYQVPEVIALPLVVGHAPYLAWLDEELA